jgi:hypothetical protein
LDIEDGRCKRLPGPARPSERRHSNREFGDARLSKAIVGGCTLRPAATTLTRAGAFTREGWRPLKRPRRLVRQNAAAVVDLLLTVMNEAS